MNFNIPLNRRTDNTMAKRYI